MKTDATVPACHLDTYVMDDSVAPCDGCNTVIPTGTRVIGNITSCCGAGCSRVLCEPCVRAAVALLEAPNDD